MQYFPNLICPFLYTFHDLLTVSITDKQNFRELKYWCGTFKQILFKSKCCACLESLYKVMFEFCIFFSFSEKFTFYRPGNKHTENRRNGNICGIGNTLLIHLCADKDNAIRNHSNNNLVGERTGGVIILLRSATKKIQQRGGSATIHY